MSQWAWRAARREIHLLRIASLVVGIGFVLYLLYPELFIIGCICLYCTSVHAITFVLFVLIVFASAAWGVKPGAAWKVRLPLAMMAPRWVPWGPRSEGCRSWTPARRRRAGGGPGSGVAVGVAGVGEDVTEGVGAVTSAARRGPGEGLHIAPVHRQRAGGLLVFRRDGALDRLPFAGWMLRPRSGRRPGWPGRDPVPRRGLRRR